MSQISEPSRILEFLGNPLLREEVYQAIRDSELITRRLYLQ